MIQFKRGNTKSWAKQEQPLAEGQPGYDKDRKKIKIGNGKDKWEDLPYASGMFMDEILDSEENAKKKLKTKLAAGILNPIAGIVNLVTSALKLDDRPIITYGEEAPDKNTVGQVYLQCYDAEPETDYIIASGIDSIWTYQIWKSGKARCWGALALDTPLQNAVGNGCLFNNNKAMQAINYPFTFLSTEGHPYPCETATLSSAKNKVAWLASVAPNNAKMSGTYTILSFDKQDSASYKIVLDVKGTIDTEAWKKES